MFGLYDVDGSQPHLPLPMPDIERLAKAAKADPPRKVYNAIVKAAKSARRGKDGSVDPYWLHAEVQQDHQGVSIGEVARVLLKAGFGPKGK